MSFDKVDLLFPHGEDAFTPLSDISFHDLGIDFIINKLTDKTEEKLQFEQIFLKMTDDPHVTQYRIDIFDDIYNNPQMCTRLLEQLEKINYEKRFSRFTGNFEETNSAWELLHHLEQLSGYIKSVESIHDCLEGYELKSEGINKLKNYINTIYTDNGFRELKKDISQLKASTDNLKSITLGINLNEKYEANGIGLISFNKKTFTNSSAIGEFVTKVAQVEQINQTTEWKNGTKFHSLETDNDIFTKILSIAGANDPRVQTATFHMDKIANSMIGSIVHKLKNTLKKYVFIPVTEITDLIPQFIFYIRFAEYIKKMQAKGFSFCKPSIALDKPKCYMDARGIYNFKLVSAFEEKGPSEIITNDLDFSSDHLAYILTGANRGGKTTITQAIGLLFVLAQAGLYVPGQKFDFMPVDSIYTHFPADEDKTLDLGRLGEECKRFKELYTACSPTSLLLLNETYSTTSFEEGYFIAKDSVRAILAKGVRTIYNTHMHKLAFDIEEINSSVASSCKYKAASIVVKAKDGQRSFKVELAPPEGVSFAKDIAQKYGVTFEMLTERK